MYATLLSKHLLPRLYQKLNLVALPAKINDDGKLVMLRDFLAFAADGNHTSFSRWFEKTEQTWEERKKTGISLQERYDYHRLLTSQNVEDRFRVIYNSSGSNLASCVLDIDTSKLRVDRRSVRGMVVDTTCYHFSCRNKYGSSLLMRAAEFTHCQ